MEVTFGNASEFAIQAMLEPELKPPSHIWGRMCLWVSGIQLGDYNDGHCGLAQCTSHLNQIVEIIDQLSASVFGDKDDQDIYSFLENASHNSGFDDNAVENKFMEFHKFRFDYGFAEMFDREPMSFLIKQPTGTLKLLFKTNNDNKLNSHVFNEQLFKKSIERFNGWYDEQSILMSSKNA